MRLEPLELELHDFVALAVLHHHREMLDVDDVVVVALDPWLVVLGVAPSHVLELGLVGHFHGIDFLELGDIKCRRIKEDLPRKKSMPTSGDLSGIVLVKTLRKTRGSRSC